MKFLISLLFLGSGLAALSRIANGQESQYTFDSDLDSLVSTNGIWQWSNRESFPWSLPDGPDGFAVQYMPGSGDVLYDSEVDIQYGFDYEITYYISSEEPGTTILKVQQLNTDGTILQDIDDFQSDPTSFQWVTISGTFAASDEPSRFGVFCQTAGINLVSQPFYGCAIDSIIISVQSAPSTTPEAPTTADITTQSSGSTEVVDFDFLTGTQGWVLGTSNGASWVREYSPPIFLLDPDTTFLDFFLLRLEQEDVYSGTALATSPRLRVGDHGVVNVRVEYYLSGTPDFPVYLKLRRRYSYTTYDDEVVINMDPWGDQQNTQWLTQSGTISGVTPGDEFNLVLEGSLGILKEHSVYEVMVSRVYLEGVSVIPYEETDMFDFSDGLTGWQAGSMDGGKWVVVPYSDLPEELNIPDPLSDNILTVDRYDIHSGVITIESPPISVTPGTTKHLQISLLIRGSQTYPVIFRLGLKTLDGDYRRLPFIDLTPQGDANSQDWSTLEDFETIPLSPEETEFQLVFEVDLGGNMNNLIAIDAFSVLTLPFVN